MFRIVIVSFKLPIIVTKRLDNNNGWHIEFENELSFLSNLRILGDKYEIVFVGMLSNDLIVFHTYNHIIVFRLARDIL